ncbi:hypothetical protein PR048_026667 [Dryococelus australis]|uniref:Uncharacterized protein n=1 Tax=Dryococelus australis TaxID=614101 RepID=A0ABQ9GLZ8_9NEOP|nr:hypothetical protein PR048_026667 [Dryococelus australis]
MQIVLSTNDGKIKYILPEFEISNFPSRTQTVQRCTQLVAESSGEACGQEGRDGYIRTTLLSRSAMPKFCQISDFKPMPIV